MTSVEQQVDSPPAPRSAGTPHGGLLAANLKRLRQESRLSLSRVAREAGISKGTLSELESGRGNPTMTTLVDLALALGATPSDLLAGPAASPLRVVRAEEPVDIDGPVVSVRFTDRLAGPGEVAELYHMRVPVTGEPQHSPGHSGVEHLIIRTGHLRIGPEGDEVEVGPGDYIAFDATAPHSYWARDDAVHVTYILTYPAAEGRSRPRDPHRPDLLGTDVTVDTPC